MSDVEIEDQESIRAEVRARRLARWGGWFFPLSAALGVGLGLFVSLWVGAWKLERSVVVYAEPIATAGGAYPVRVELRDGEQEPLEVARVEVRVESPGEPAVHLGDLPPLGAGFPGTFGATLQFPEWAERDGTLVVIAHQDAEGETRWEAPVKVRTSREPSVPEVLSNESKLALTDDSDPQPEAVKIDVRAMGQMMAPFTNVFMVRVTDPEGRPIARSVKVSVVSGVFAGTSASVEAPLIVYEGETDVAGLARFKGRVESEVVRFKVEFTGVVDEVEGGVDKAVEGKTKPAGNADASTTRIVRLVGFPGAAKLRVAGPLALVHGASVRLQLALIGLRGMVIDVHDATGTWIDTIVQPKGGSLSHEWQIPLELPEGIVTFEAYRRSTSHRAGAMVALVYTGATSATEEALERALRRHVEAATRASSSIPAEERSREVGWLASLADLADARGGQLRTMWMLGTMPRAAYGAPVALRSLSDDEAALQARKNEIHGYVRSYLIVGGIAYMLLFAGSLLLDAKLRSVGLTGAEVGALREAAASPMEVAARFAVMLMLVAGTLALIIALFDNLIWSTY